MCLISFTPLPDTAPNYPQHLSLLSFGQKGCLLNNLLIPQRTVLRVSNCSVQSFYLPRNKTVRMLSIKKIVLYDLGVYVHYFVEPRWHSYASWDIPLSCLVLCRAFGPRNLQKRQKGLPKIILPGQPVPTSVHAHFSSHEKTCKNRTKQNHQKTLTFICIFSGAIFPGKKFSINFPDLCNFYHYFSPRIFL
jgi:hypothetical protein